MIVVDIETSGLYPERHGIWQIGALDFYNPRNTFLEESRIDDEDEATEGAAKIHGKSEEYLRNRDKQSQKQLLENFFNWTGKVDIKNCICQNPQFDIGFISYKARKYSLKLPFHYRVFDLHSIASKVYHDSHGDFLMEENHSGMGLSKTLELCGLQDNRKEHNALEDAKLTAECFSRIINGKSLFKEFSQYKIPDYLTR